MKSYFDNFRSDENVMLLLSAIALFNPDRSNVVHKDVVKKEQVSHVSHISQVSHVSKVSHISHVSQNFTHYLKPMNKQVYFSKFC